ncbi:ribosomal protein S5 domain 2-type protein [Kockiozyma suomiensis]|uniref:ribosomal protein S5 domain 2-type protein n=1 Tax=Kockiozyma suomiensis TaxID=1337062 RepID=UPI0033441A1E
MPLSIAEENYLSTSLSQKPPCRPDGRDPHTFRPLDAAAGILPATNGSARIRLCDGGECIVGVKAEVEVCGGKPVEVQCDIAGQLNNSPLQSFLCTTLESAVRNALPPSHLSISNKYTYKLYIDGIILDHVSHPLTLLSMTIFLALLNTRLPTLITEDNTDENDEIGLPQFESDWQQSRLLCDDWLPPLVQLAVVAGRNVFVDPTGEEAAVSDGGILAIWHQSKVVGLRTVNTRDSSRQVFNVKSVATAVDVLTQTSREVENALRKVVAST